MRKESFWTNQVGSVATVSKGDDRYPVVVRFENGNYAGVTTNNFALDELVEVAGPPAKKAKKAKARSGSPAMVVAEVDKEDKVSAEAAATRTEMTAPFFSKTGQEQWKAITEEENARGRERMKDPNNQGTFNRMRNGAVGLLPGYFRRGFSDAFDDDDSRGKKAKKSG
jgi:photosystem I subunit 4